MKTHKTKLWKVEVVVSLGPPRKYAYMETYAKSALEATEAVSRYYARHSMPCLGMRAIGYYGKGLKLIESTG